MRGLVMGAIEEVKQRADIVEVISQYTKLSKAGRTLRGLCPFHSEKTPSFFVYPEQQSWYCFGACNTGGDVFSFIVKKENLPFPEALQLLAARVGVSLPERAETEGAKEKTERLYQANEAAAGYYHQLLLNSPAGEGARGYLLRRGLTLETSIGFQLGVSPGGWETLKLYLLERGYTEEELLKAGLLVQSEDGKTHDRFRHKLTFPIRDIRGRILGFGARVLDDSLPKYINSPQTPLFDKSSILYGIDRAGSAIRKEDRVVIVEGYLDVIVAHQHGFVNVVASMGTAITERQINILKRLTRNLVLALDADQAGEEAMLRGIAYENMLGAEVKVAVLPEGKDPDDVVKEGGEGWRKLVEQAFPVVDFTFKSVTPKLDLSTARGKSQAVEQLMPVVAGIRDTIRRGHYLNELARAVGAGSGDIELAYREYLARRRGKASEAKTSRTSTRPGTSPLEEYCLALLIRHPELKEKGEELPPDYFESSEHREILALWRGEGDVSLLKERLDPALRERLEAILSRSLVEDKIEEKFADIVLRLRERYLRGLEAKRRELLTLAREAGGTEAELAKLAEGTEISTKLGEVFAQRNKRR
ncbi:MAG: DNA primase [Chloroflexota bacterium]